MGFWETFWATMWGALGGAVVAAFAAWLFSLDLRRRERDDRKQEREQDRLDRQVERAQASAEREAELLKERQERLAERSAEAKQRASERKEERDHENARAMRRQWVKLSKLITEYAWASDARRPSMYPRLNSEIGLTGAMATGVDRKLFDKFKSLFSIDDFNGDIASGLTSILWMHGRDGLPLAFVIEALESLARERDEPATSTAHAPTTDSDEEIEL